MHHRPLILAVALIATASWLCGCERRADPKLDGTALVYCTGVEGRLSITTFDTGVVQTTEARIENIGFITSLELLNGEMYAYASDLGEAATSGIHRIDPVTRRATLLVSKEEHPGLKAPIEAVGDHIFAFSDSGAVLYSPIDGSVEVLPELRRGSGAFFGVHEQSIVFIDERGRCIAFDIETRSMQVLRESTVFRNVDCMNGIAVLSGGRDTAAGLESYIRLDDRADGSEFERQLSRTSPPGVSPDDYITLADNVWLVFLSELPYAYGTTLIDSSSRHKTWIDGKSYFDGFLVPIRDVPRGLLQK